MPIIKLSAALKREKLKRLTPAQIFLLGGTPGGSSGGGGEEPGVGVEWQWEDEENLQWEDDSTIDTEE